MRVFRNMAVIVLALSLTGCAAALRTIDPTKEYTHDWQVDSVNRIDLGDAAVARGEIYTYEAMELRNQVSFGDGFLLKKFTVPPGLLIAKQEDDNWTHYYHEDFTIFDSGFTSKGQGGLKIKKDNPDDVNIFWNSVSVRPSPKPEFTLKRTNALNRPGIRKELIYNGIDGNVVKFIYRETTNDLTQKPFTQDVEFDTSSDPVINFKGSKIEVLETTDRQLAYKILQNFPGTD